MPEEPSRDTPCDHITMRGIISRPSTYRDAVRLLPRTGDRLSSTGTGPQDLEVVSVSKPWRDSPDQDWQFEATYRRLPAAE